MADSDDPNSPAAYNPVNNGRAEACCEVGAGICSCRRLPVAVVKLELFLYARGWALRRFPKLEIQAIFHGNTKGQRPNLIGRERNRLVYDNNHIFSQ